MFSPSATFDGCFAARPNRPRCSDDARGSVATLEEAKTKFQKSWDPWQAWVASEDRTHQLQAEVELWRDRAGSAEQWLRIIQKEIEEKLIAQSSSRAEQASLH
jgi:hypothetical protein